MFELLFFGKFDIYAYSMSEDILVVLMMYSFLKLILLSSIFELIWPTQFFNRRNSSSVVNYRLRTYTETVLKLLSPGIKISETYTHLNFN